MALTHGKGTVITVATVDLSAFTKSSDLDISVDSHDTTTYGVDNHVYQAGLIDGTFSMEGVYSDAGATAPRDTLVALQGAAPAAIVRQAEGAGAGKAQDSFTGLLTSYAESSPVDDMVTWSAEFQISGAVDTTVQA